MNFLGVHVYPDLLEESWRELERERRRDREIRERRAARRAEAPSRLAAAWARLRHVPRPAPCPPALEGC
jgi:hypothetical protein